MKRITLLASITMILSACATMTESRPQNDESNPVSEPFTLLTNNLTGEGIFLVGNGLTAHLSSRTDPNIPDAAIPILKFWYPNDNKYLPGHPAHYNAWFLLRTQEPTVTYNMQWGAMKPRLNVLLQIVELDDTNQAPEVLLSSYSGGAHCCSAITIFSQDKHEDWQHTKLDWLDGLPIGATTIHGIDENVIALRDGSFLYMFAAYAQSFAPYRIYTLESGKLVDISDRDILIPYFKKQAALLDEQLSESKMQENNGFWAGYVATKARAGEFDHGWDTMLANYDRDSTWLLEGYDNFPEALNDFLTEYGYID